ncbi:MAG: S8 family peptidase [Bdellovibrionota bacterium]
MKRCNWKSLLAGVCVILAASCSKSKNKQEANLGQNFRNGEVIVRADNIQAVLDESPDLKAEPVWVELNMYSVAGKSIAGKEREFAESLMSKGLATSAEPNFIVSIAKDQELKDRTTDPMWLDLWGLSNIGQDAPKGTEGKEGADIGILKAWEKTKGSDEVLVAVMDTGIDYLHPDLKDNIYINKYEFAGQANKKDDDPEADKICIDAEKKRCYADDIFGWNFVSYNETELYMGVPGKPDPMDGNGHGTHVAGTIGALANNGIGVAGINQKVKMIALKVLSDEGSGDSADIIRAIRYAALKKVDVVNASFGGGGESQNFLAALEQAEKAGVLFVAAAGNESDDADQTDHFPASYDVEGVLSVAATDNRDMLAEFSNYGYQKVDLAAPGVNIISTYPRQLAANEGTPDNPYRVFSGTSMATPHVVGAAALVLADRKDLRKNPKALKKLLMESSDWKPQLAGRVRSGGRLNVARALANEVVNFMEDKKWTEIEYKWSSPSLPESHLDILKTIKQDGVKAIQAHIASNLMDSIDLSAVYDGALRLVSFIPGDLVSMPHRNKDYWTPVVYGDSITLRFANSLVSVTKVKEKRVVTEPEISEMDGDVSCFPTGNQDPSGQDLFECTVMDEPSDPFGNNRSEGFTVDKIRVLK